MNHLNLSVDQLTAFAQILALLFLWISLTIVAGLAVALFEEWQRFRRAQPPQPSKEINMKSRIILVAVMAAALTIIGLQPGCSTLGNGQIDIPVDVSVEWHDTFGNGFVLENGTLTEATYRSVKTGVLYEVAADGFQISAPDGTKIRIQKKAEDQSAIQSLAPPG